MLAATWGCACRDFAEEVGYAPLAGEGGSERAEGNLPDGGSVPPTTGGEGPVAPAIEIPTADLTQGVGVHYIEQSDERATVWYTILGEDREPGDVTPDSSLQLVRDDLAFETSGQKVDTLASTPRRIAVMFVVANHAGFDPLAHGVVPAVRSFTETLGANDAVGLVHYGSDPGPGRRIDIQPGKTFIPKLGKWKHSTETDPDPFAAIEVATREFHALDDADEFLRFMIIIGDGGSRWDSLPSRVRWQERAVGALTRARTVPILVGMGGPAQNDGHQNYRRVAEGAGTAFVPAADAAALSRVLDGLAGQIQSTERWQFNGETFEDGSEWSLRVQLPDRILKSVPQEVVKK